VIQILLSVFCSIRLGGYAEMEWAPTVFIVAGTLALLCGAATLPLGLLIAAFLTVLATVVVVVVLEVAPTKGSTDSSSAVIFDRSKSHTPR
jgi:hypothetical protein